MFKKELVISKRTILLLFLAYIIGYLTNQLNSYDFDTLRLSEKDKKENLRLKNFCESRDGHVEVFYNLFSRFAMQKMAEGRCENNNKEGVWLEYLPAKSRPTLKTFDVLDTQIGSYKRNKRHGLWLNQLDPNEPIAEVIHYGHDSSYPSNFRLRFFNSSSLRGGSARGDCYFSVKSNHLVEIDCSTILDDPDFRVVVKKSSGHRKSLFNFEKNISNHSE